MSLLTRSASINELSELVSAEVHGNPKVTISGIATLELAEKDHLSFFFKS